MARHGIAETLVGAGVLLVAAAFLVFAISRTGRATSAGYRLQASFERIDGLAVGADVRIAGVKVGSIMAERLDPKTYQANVTLSVGQGIQLPKDSSAEIASESLLGGKYLNLSPGGDTVMLAPGGTISITQSSINLEQLVGKFIFGGGTGAKPETPATPAPDSPK
jgi:phospholipid/cholesterol/gamma-HCH transport system substrate-binding protein